MNKINTEVAKAFRQGKYFNKQSREVKDNAIYLYGTKLIQLLDHDIIEVNFSGHKEGTTLNLINDVMEYLGFNYRFNIRYSEIYCNDSKIPEDKPIEFDYMKRNGQFEFHS